MVFVALLFFGALGGLVFVGSCIVLENLLSKLFGRSTARTIVNALVVLLAAVVGITFWWLIFLLFGLVNTVVLILIATFVFFVLTSLASPSRC